MTLQLAYDPRNPPETALVHKGSTHTAHQKLRKTLVLLAIDTTDGPVYFVVKGMQEWPSTYEDMQDEKRYFYESHTCPINFINAEMIAHRGRTDPHGVFRFIEAVWMTCDFEAYKNEDFDEYLCAVFPQILSENLSNNRDASE